MTENGSERLRFDAFFQGPGQLLRAPGPNHEKSARIKPECLQPRTIGQAELMSCRIRRSPKKEVSPGTAQTSHPSGDQRLRKTESGPAILIGLGPHLMQAAWGQTVPGQNAIDFRKTKRPVVFLRVGRSFGRPRLVYVRPGQAYGLPRLVYVCPGQAYGLPRLVYVCPGQAYGLPRLLVFFFPR